jgi:signal transduction histidine kinase
MELGTVIVNKEKKWRISLGLIAFIYAGCALYLIFFIFNLNNQIRQNKINYENDVKHQITTILNSNVDIASKLEKLYQDKRIELVVLNGQNKKIYGSMSFTSIDELKKEINSKVISNKVMYQIKTDNDNYQIFLAVYFLDSQFYFNNFIFIVCSVSLLFSTLLFIIVVLLYRKMVNPLSAFANNIRKLKNFDFAGIDSEHQLSEYNFLSKELEDFAFNINASIKDIENRYIDVEKRIIENEAETNIKKSMIRSLIHDLKTPITIAKMDLYNANVDDEYLKDVSKILDDLPNKINEILKILHLEEIPMEKNDFNLVKILNEVIQEYKPLMNGGIYFEFITEEMLFVNSYPLIIKQIVGNGLSNAIKYLSNGDEIIMTLEGKNNYFNLKISNSSTPIKQEVLDKAFGLLTRINANEEGSGSGLFIVKSLVEYLKGEVSLKYENECVVLNITIPIENMNDVE